MENGCINYTLLAFRLYFHKIYFDSVFHYICCLSQKDFTHFIRRFYQSIYSISAEFLRLLDSLFLLVSGRNDD